jgi:hypothetical protein
MKRLLKTLFVAAPLLGIGCVPNDSAIHILNAFPYQNALSMARARPFRSASRAVPSTSPGTRPTFSNGRWNPP